MTLFCSNSGLHRKDWGDSLQRYVNFRKNVVFIMLDDIDRESTNNDRVDGAMVDIVIEARTQMLTIHSVR